jgi:hypothetical protein
MMAGRPWRQQGRDDLRLLLLLRVGSAPPSWRW